MSDTFDSVFQQLKTLLKPYEARLVVNTDTERHYHLDTAHIMKNKKPLFFGAVRIGKSYVSYHLMPVYVTPDLLKNLSPELQKRMQGKSCFNFKNADSLLFAELAELTAAGITSYSQAGYL